MALAPGVRLGPYEIVSALGAGGMGEVYKARDTRLDRMVAIKVLPEHVATDSELKQRFEREAKTISSLNHPHICTLHDVGSQDGIDFLVMEHLEGETLADRLRKGTLPLDQALQTAIQIADALDKAHRQGIVHRDLKPANIKVTPGGKVKVLDFGLAKAFEGTQADPNATNSPTLSMAATQQGVILGTAAYMSPEQARGEHADQRADVWAFGVVLSEMLTGRPAFDGKTDVAHGLSLRKALTTPRAGCSLRAGGDSMLWTQLESESDAGASDIGRLPGRRSRDGVPPYDRSNGDDGDHATASSWGPALAARHACWGP